MKGKPHDNRRTHRKAAACWRSVMASLALFQAALATPASALELRRGLNLDTWVEWLPVETMLERPGFLDVFPDWRRHVPIERLAELCQSGFDFVRLPIEPGPLLALGPGERRQGLIDQVVETVELLHDTDLAVIVDLHLVSRPGNHHGTEAVLAEPAAYLELVEAVAKALAGLDPARTAFEPINEPNHDCGAVARGESILWPPMLERLHATARRAMLEFGG
jgi:endoglucanase